MKGTSGAAVPPRLRHVPRRSAFHRPCTPDIAQPAWGADRPRYYNWPELLRRVFAVDVLECDACGGRREVIAVLVHPRVVRAILACLGLPTEPPAIAPATHDRAPPLFEADPAADVTDPTDAAWEGEGESTGTDPYA